MSTRTSPQPPAVLNIRVARLVVDRRVVKGGSASADLGASLTARIAGRLDRRSAASYEQRAHVADAIADGVEAAVAGRVPGLGRR